MFNSIMMTQFAATIAEAMGVEKPQQAGKPIEAVRHLMDNCPDGQADRVLIYNPDAIGMWLFQKYTEEFTPVLKHVQLGVPVKTVMPSVTPVCFGSMYTGAEPAIHGIQKYEKHVIDTDSLFDAIPRSGKKAAIVAVENSSMAIIYGGRNVDYYILPYDGEVNKKALELIEMDQYDLIAVYNQEYDDMMHRTGTESAESMAAMGHHIQAFDSLAAGVKRHWKDHNTMICWATDHGIHQMEDGRGNHGDAIGEDLNIMHFYGICPRERQV